ncbi:MAG TPA: S1 RNA-binding domain-containing protein [Acidimicrobiales bacterium]|nr:S1 RNA-binding domain-containing protein [Acidimicrobiales bacterium]
MLKHVVVDGSNIATEGRETPSLTQLDAAVRAFIEEYGPGIVTVVVDATFPNRIEAKERRTFEEAVAAGELITPPAGAIGRGDAFVLQIARRADAAILSNDSFQEFHGDYPWLFEKGRLIGGKPVPHVGWVFMERTPVRGPTSRRSVSEAREAAGTSTKAAKPAKAAKASAGAKAAKAGAEPKKAKEQKRPKAKAAKGAKAAQTSEQAADAAFVADHPVGSEVEATVERFGSHGAYVVRGGVRGYVPLRYLADPAPRSAKEVLQAGETRRYVVAAVDPSRESLDLALPGLVEVPAAGKPATAPAQEEPAPKAAAKRASAPAKASAGKKAAKKAAKKAREKTTKKAAAKAAPAKKARAKKAPAKKAPSARETSARQKR